MHIQEYLLRNPRKKKEFPLKNEKELWQSTYSLYYLSIVPKRSTVLTSGSSF